jgi:hypothetical protein
MLLALLSCVIFLALIVGAFALDDFGMYGRIIGTIMMTVALWGPDLLIARGRAVERSAAEDCVVPPSGDTAEASEPGFPRPWWRRRYTLSPAQMLFLGGLGGVAIGCIVALALNKLYLPSLLAWGGGLGVMGIVFMATVRLTDKAHPHHAMFEAGVRHVSRFLFVALFALGVWQRFPAGFVVILSGGLCALVLFTLGTVWSLVLMGRAVYSFGDRDYDTGYRPD